MFIILLVFFLAIIGWVSYYTSASIYRTLKKKDNPNARTFQVLTFLLMFAALLALGFYFIVSNMAFQR